MATGTAFRRIANARLRDAEVLFRNRRYQGAVYLCGYAIELSLKSAICKALAWTECLTTRDYSTFKTHDFNVLLTLTGRAALIRSRHINDWSVVLHWTPEMRYDPVGSVNRSDAARMIASTKRLLKVL